MTDKEKRIVQFLIDARIKIEEIIDLSEKYDLKDDLLSVISIGVIKDSSEDLGFHKIDAITSIFAENEEELASILYHISQSFVVDDEEADHRDIGFWLNLGDDSIN